jgi:hypothetical protein
MRLTRTGVEELWPSFRPGDYAQRFARHWVRRAQSNPAIMAAILFSSSMHRDARAPMLTRSQRLKQLRLKGETVSTLRAIMSSGDLDSDIDATIYTILCLATTPNESELPPAQTNPFKARSFDFQWVSLYSRMPFDATHSSAIVALVEKLGGINMIKEYSVAWLVFL